MDLLSNLDGRADDMLIIAFFCVDDVLYSDSLQSHDEIVQS